MEEAKAEESASKRRKVHKKPTVDDSTPMEEIKADEPVTETVSDAAHGHENGRRPRSKSPTRFSIAISPTTSPTMSPSTSPPPISTAALPPPAPTSSTSRIPKKGRIPRVGQQPAGLSKPSLILGRQTSDPASSSASTTVNGPVTPIRQTSADAVVSTSPPPPSVDAVEAFISQTKEELSHLATLSPSPDRWRSVSPTALIKQLTQLSAPSSDPTAVTRIHAALSTPAQISSIVALLHLCHRAIRDEPNSRQHRGWVELAKELAILLTALWKVRQWVVDQLKAVDAVVRVLRDEAERMKVQGEEWVHLLAYCRRLMTAYEAVKPRTPRCRSIRSSIKEHASTTREGRRTACQRWLTSRAKRRASVVAAPQPSQQHRRERRQKRRRLRGRVKRRKAQWRQRDLLCLLPSTHLRPPLSRPCTRDLPLPPPPGVFRTSQCRTMTQRLCPCRHGPYPRRRTDSSRSGV